MNNRNEWLRKSADFYNKTAAHYADQYGRVTPGGYALRIRQQRVLERLDSKQGKVLDVGCGPGYLGRELIKSGHEYWGVDSSPKMVELCRQQLPRACDRLVVGDATKLPFPDGFFDVVISLGVIDRIPMYEEALEEMVRVTKEHGTLIISFPNLCGPYAAWKAYVFYPIVAVLQPIYFKLKGRPRTPSQLSCFFKLHTARSAAKLLAAKGARVSENVYFYFNIFLSPLDEIFPHLTFELTKKMESLSLSRLKCFGAAFLVKAEKIHDGL